MRNQETKMENKSPKEMRSMRSRHVAGGAALWQIIAKWVPDSTPQHHYPQQSKAG